jgi:hypothetical protein
VWTLRIPAPTGWLSKNQRRHRLVQAEDVKLWRQAGQAWALKGRVPRMGRVHITAVVRFPADRRRRDAPNVYLSVAAVVDGLQDAGVLADDNDSYVTGLHIVPGEPVPVRPYGPCGELVLTIEEVNEKEDD